MPRRRTISPKKRSPIKKIRIRRTSVTPERTTYEIVRAPPLNFNESFNEGIPPPVSGFSPAIAAPIEESALERWGLEESANEEDGYDMPELVAESVTTKSKKSKKAKKKKRDKLEKDPHDSEGSEAEGHDGKETIIEDTPKSKKSSWTKNRKKKEVLKDSDECKNENITSQLMSSPSSSKPSSSNWKMTKYFGLEDSMDESEMPESNVPEVSQQLQLRVSPRQNKGKKADRYYAWVEDFVEEPTDSQPKATTQRKKKSQKNMVQQVDEKPVKSTKPKKVAKTTETSESMPRLDSIVAEAIHESGPSSSMDYQPEVTTEDVIVMINESMPELDAEDVTLKSLESPVKISPTKMKKKNKSVAKRKLEIIETFEEEEILTKSVESEVAVKDSQKMLDPNSFIFKYSDEEESEKENIGHESEAALSKPEVSSLSESNNKTVTEVAIKTEPKAFEPNPFILPLFNDRKSQNETIDLKPVVSPIKSEASTSSSNDKAATEVPIKFPFESFSPYTPEQLEMFQARKAKQPPHQPLPSGPVGVKLVPENRASAPAYISITQQEFLRLLPRLPPCDFQRKNS